MESDQTNTFSTDNFALTAYLLTESCRLLYCDKSNLRRVVFCLEKTDELEKLVQKFLSNEAKVEPNRFFSSQKNLKQLIYGN